MQDGSSAARGSAAIDEKDDSSSASGGGKPKARKDGRLYVEKNSLNESQLVAARDDARSELQRLTELGQATEDDMKKEKRAANRLSAFQSRKRRVGVIHDLEQKTTKLQNDNKEQASQISDQGEKIRRMTEENERLREELESRKRGATSSSSGDTSSRGAVGGQTAADAGATGSAESKRESVQNMLVHLQTLQKQQQADRDNLSQQQSRDRNELSTAQRHQQEQLKTVQSQEQKQLSTSQQQDQRQLTSRQDRELLSVLHGFGLPAGDRREAMALVGELANVSRSSTAVDSNAGSPRHSGAGPAPQPPFGNNNNDGAAGPAAGR